MVKTLWSIKKFEWKYSLVVLNYDGIFANIKDKWYIEILILSHIGTPVVTLPRNKYSVTANKDVTLDCGIIASPPATFVAWQRIRNGVVQNLVTTGSLKYSGGTTNNPSLTIHRVASGDEGHYICIASNMAGNSKSEAVYLRVVACEWSMIVTGDSVANSVEIFILAWHSVLDWIHVLTEFIFSLYSGSVLLASD